MPAGGLVLMRQIPGCAKGVMFISIEDEILNRAVARFNIGKKRRPWSSCVNRYQGLGDTIVQV